MSISLTASIQILNSSMYISLLNFLFCIFRHYVLLLGRLYRNGLGIIGQPRHQFSIFQK